MIAVTDDRYFFGILGMPSSGTSIINRFFDSLENCVCVSEPMHKNGRKTKRFKFRGLKEFNINEFNPSLFLERFKASFLDSNYKLCGFKEVSLTGDKYVNRWDYIIENRNLLNLCVYVLRDPVDNINSIIKRSGRFNNPTFENVIESYLYFLDMIEKDDRAYIIVYEDFCENPKEYINKTFAKLFHLEGELNLRSLSESNVFAAAVEAYENTNIERPRSNNILTEEQLKTIKEVIQPKYLKIKYENNNNTRNA
jgi:hypothetical protein